MEVRGRASRQPSYEYDIVGTSTAVQRILKLVSKIAPTESGVLITGESGTGKELVARQIHYLSKRNTKAFVPVNCAAIPEGLFESELFGHVKGAFTGAVQSKKGLFEEADGGTLFLDEVAEMPSSAQVKLLRALQSHEIRRVGGNEDTHIDVRVIAATNRDIKEALRTGELREDLYYRLNVFHIHVPPLRERRDDILILAQYFVEKHSLGRKGKTPRISPSAASFLLAYDYPGNIRELENIVQRAVLLAESGVINPRDLPPEIRQRRMLTSAEEKSGYYSDGFSLEEVERLHIMRVLEKHKWNMSRAAKALGISRSTLWRKLRGTERGGRTSVSKRNR
ncbi:MAG: sigma-54 dependent transcriptional regulator [Candidatus Eisenbacteria bacterium]|nr:sigma-54 dependent transcriptional regulator [Candidatus Eisenbacteria bacterium]